MEGTAIQQFLVRARVGCEPCSTCCVGAEKGQRAGGSVAGAV